MYIFEAENMFEFFVSSQNLDNANIWNITQPLPWASVHWLVQCTLECHWNATGWRSVIWDTTGKT